MAIILRAKETAQAAAALRQGKLIVLPTDTVYGVAALAFDAAAVRRLYLVKQRPFSKAIPILLADPTDLDKVVQAVPPLAQALIDQFWPGPLTIVLPKKQTLPDVLSPYDGVAVRIPDCDVARAVIRQAGGAIAATSANLSGQPEALTAAEAVAYLGNQVAVVLDNGRSPGTVASTVIDCQGETPVIVRPGPITANDLDFLRMPPA
ncbi:MAG: threonylcarbamoyl-AMP synthase [Anaerolineales bacterium]|nr:threonylcarbamoyl-AMP synthase [Anaerolineales bacterium]